MSPRLIVVAGVALVFLGVLVAFLLAWRAWRRREAGFRLLVRERTGGQAAGQEVQIDSGDPMGDPTEAPSPGWLSDLLQQARSELTPKEMITRSAALSLLGVVVLALVSRHPLAILGAGLGALPLWLLRRRAAALALQMSEQLPTALDLVNRALRGGHSLPEAMRLGAAEIPAPLGQELARISEEHRLGLDMRDALKALIHRNPYCIDLRMFAGSVLLQRETGAALVEMLERLSETIRERIVFKGKVLALTAEVRASAMILIALPFFVTGLLLLMRPSYLAPLIDTDLGQKLLAGGCTSLLVGTQVMRRLARVEV